MSSEARDVEMMTAGLRAARAIGRAASVVPCTVSASTNGSVYRIAGRAAALIRLDAAPFLRAGAWTHEHQPPALAS